MEVGMKRGSWRESVAFIAPTFGVTWLLWFGVYFGYAPPFVPFITLGTIIPSVMGLIFSYAFGKKQELMTLIYSTIRFKASLLSWFYATLLFPLILLCACAAFSAIGGTLPPAQFPIWFSPVAFLYIFACMGPLGEELGWRGFLLKRFLLKWGVVKSGLAVGLIWSAWHIPLFLIPGTIQNELAKLGLPIVLSGYFIYTTCISLLMTVLYIRTDGNLLLCMVFHTICNLSLGVAPIILTKSGAAFLLITLIIVTAGIIAVSEYWERSKQQQLRR